MAITIKDQRFKVTDIVQDDYKYFTKIVRVYSAAVIDDENCHLTDRELELLYCVHKAISSGRRDILSLDVIRVYFRSFKDKKTLQVWVPKLIEKKWLVEQGGNYYINGDFENLAFTQKTTFYLDIIRK